MNKDEIRTYSHTYVQSVHHVRTVANKGSLNHVTTTFPALSTTTYSTQANWTCAYVQYVRKATYSNGVLERKIFTEIPNQGCTFGVSPISRRRFHFSFCLLPMTCVLSLTGTSTTVLQLLYMKHHTAHDGGRRIVRFDQKASHTSARRHNLQSHICAINGPALIAYMCNQRTLQEFQKIAKSK